MEENKKERQIDNLINVVENHTRTTRHLEQYSDIGNPENKDHAREIQGIREEQINDLKENILCNNDAPTKEEQAQDLKENIKSSDGYIESNGEHMNKEQLKDLEQKQKNREGQLENLQENMQKEGPTNNY